MHVDTAALSVEGIVGWLILTIVAVAGLFDVARTFGFLPDRVVRVIYRNRLRETLQVLDELGIDIDAARRNNAVAPLENITSPELTDRVEKRVKAVTIAGKMTVGATVSASGDAFVDMMGACADQTNARVFARDLAALWRQLVAPGGLLANYEVDFIVTPKTGSPLLGSAFASLLRKPLLLHNHEPKFRTDPDNPKAHFDCFELPQPGTRALIVDDSSTGGGKVLAAVEDLQKFGYKVSDLLVVFEPQLKVSTGDNAARRLQTKAVTLHSII